MGSPAVCGPHAGGHCVFCEGHVTLIRWLGGRTEHQFWLNVTATTTARTHAQHTQHTRIRTHKHSLIHSLSHTLTHTHTRLHTRRGMLLCNYCSFHQESVTPRPLALRTRSHLAGLPNLQHELIKPNRSRQTPSRASQLLSTANRASIEEGSIIIAAVVRKVQAKAYAPHRTHGPHFFSSFFDAASSAALTAS